MIGGGFWRVATAPLAERFGTIGVAHSCLVCLFGKSIYSCLLYLI